MTTNQQRPGYGVLGNIADLALQATGVPRVARFDKADHPPAKIQ